MCRRLSRRCGVSSGGHKTHQQGNKGEERAAAHNAAGALLSMTWGRAGFLPHPAAGQSGTPRLGWVGGWVHPSGPQPGGGPHRQKLFLHGRSKRQLLKGAGSTLAGIACAPALLFGGGCGVQASGPGPLMPHGITPGLWAPPGTWKPGWGAEMTQLGWHSPASSGGGGCTVSPQPGWGVGVPAAPRAGGGLRAGISTRRCRVGLGAAGAGGWDLTFAVCWRGGISHAGSGSVASSSPAAMGTAADLDFLEPS